MLKLEALLLDRPFSAENLTIKVNSCENALNIERLHGKSAPVKDSALF